MQDEKKGVIYSFVAVLLLATIGVGFKLAVSRLDSFFVTVYIGFFATLSLFIYLRIAGKAWRIPYEFSKHPWFFVITGIIGLGVQQILYLKGFQLLPASQVVIIFYFYPLLMILFSLAIFKERTSIESLIFIILGFIGVYVLISGGTLIHINLSTGIIVTILASASWALFSVLIKHRKFDAEIGMFFFNLFGFIFLVCMIPFFGFSFDVTGQEILGLMYLGIFPTALAFVMWNKALHLAKTSVCSNIALLTPLLSLVLISLVLKESLSSAQILGLTLILSSVFLNLQFSRKS